VSEVLKSIVQSLYSLMAQLIRHTVVSHHKTNKDNDIYLQIFLMDTKLIQYKTPKG